MTIDLTIIIPAYNEEVGLDKMLPDLLDACKELSWKIIVVNDCSTDNTADVLEKYASRITILENKFNIGYGASIKRGVLVANTEWIATFDGDGQHRLEDLMRMADMRNTLGVDAVIGQRTKGSHASIIRKPGKFILTIIVNILVGRKIVDINCGLRIFRRKVVHNIMRLTADRFSFSVSSLVAMLKMGYSINLVPVHVDKRLGKSSVKQIRDGLATIILVMRLIMLFNPMRIILPTSVGTFTLCGIYQLVCFFKYGWNIADATVLLFIVGLLLFILALIADQISALRLEMQYAEIIDDNSSKKI
jgi:glycosyltransferase involved in cell wall biosynthesis